MNNLGTILVVDDSQESRRLLTELLGAQGFLVRAADGGELALAFAEATPPDLVMLDVRMPGMDGFEVCRRLQANPATHNVPILFLSGATESEDRARGFELGAVDFVSKPFQEDELLARVKTHMELGQLRSRLEQRVAEQTLDLLLANEQLMAEVLERNLAEAALRKSERRLANIILATHAGTWEWNVQTGETVFNERWAEIIGYTLKELSPVSIETWMHFAHPDDLKASGELLASYFRGELDRYECETRMKHRDGTWVWVLDRGGVSTWTEDGKPLLMVGTHLDISERKQLEAEKAALEAQNRQLQKAESLGLMAGSIAHHFNNKLQVVMGNLEVMGALPKGTDLTKLLTMAKLAATKAAEVSRQMLVYLGQTTLDREPQLLSACCRESLLLIQNTLPKTVTVEANFPEPGPVITANASQLHQVLTNLATNAMEAMGDAGGCLRLSLNTCPAAEIPKTHRFPIGWQPQDPEYAVLEVADTGCGIAETDIEKLFDPFFSTQFLGRGLGLSVVLGIVQGHDGAITVESKKGQGSAFRVYFPLSAETMPTVQELAVQAPESGASATGGTILLIDDDELLLMTTQELLQILGFTPLTAKDGVEGLEVFRQHQADIRCVITDLTMPRLDGWGTLSALRQLDPTLPVILASGFDKAQVLSGTHPDRPQSFLSKPFDLQQLRDALGQALVTSRSRGLR